MMKWIIVLAIGITGSAIAFQSQYAGEQKRTIKTLSEADIVGLREGRGMGYAKVAELNSYPGPMHVLEHADDLKMTATQKIKIESCMHAMRKKAKALGAQIIEAEANLDAKFKSGQANSAQVAASMERIGTLQGQLRWTHVKAHIETRALMSKSQIAKYNQLRGYVEAK